MESILERMWTQKNTVQSMEIEKLMDNPNHPLNKKRNLVVRTNTNVQSFQMQKGLADEGCYSNLMDILFQPVPELGREISKAMNSMGIKRKQYVAAHYRALADQDIEINKDSKAEMHRAIDCVVKAVEGDKSIPIYFASSRGNIVKYVLGDSPYAQSKKPAVKVVGLDYGTRIHSDKTGVGFDNPRDLYPAFVDMWLLKYSRCVSYGHLGFGRFGRYLSGEECGINYISDDKNCPSVFR